MSRIRSLALFVWGKCSAPQNRSLHVQEFGDIASTYILEYNSENALTVATIETRSSE